MRIYSLTIIKLDIFNCNLFTLKFNSSIIRTALELQPKLCSFLESSTVESRISVGETMAILYEIAVSDVGDDFQFKYALDIGCH